jgi:hypothetical protein
VYALRLGGESLLNSGTLADFGLGFAGGGLFIFGLDICVRYLADAILYLHIL